MKKMTTLCLSLAFALSSAGFFTPAADAKVEHKPCPKNLDGKKMIHACKLDRNKLQELDKKKNEGFKTEEQDWMKK